jgi:hypothetical protein
MVLLRSGNNLPYTPINISVIVLENSAIGMIYECLDKIRRFEMFNSTENHVSSSDDGIEISCEKEYEIN